MPTSLLHERLKIEHVKPRLLGHWGTTPGLNFIYRLVGRAQEITERKRAESQLRESEDRYRDLVEHSHDLICTHDLQGMLLSVNAPHRILGYSREELLNKPLRDFVPVEAQPHCDGYLSQIRRNGFATGLLPVVTRVGR
jgi:PAS domain-containing protein